MFNFVFESTRCSHKWVRLSTHSIVEIPRLDWIHIYSWSWFAWHRGRQHPSSLNMSSHPPCWVSIGLDNRHYSWPHNVYWVSKELICCRSSTPSPNQPEYGTVMKMVWPYDGYPYPCTILWLLYPQWICDSQGQWWTLRPQKITFHS